MLKKGLLFSALFSMSAGLFAQDAQRACGTVEHNLQLMQDDPQFAENRVQIEQFTQDFIANNPGGIRTVVTIPVVFHVVYNTAAENISDAQIMSQLDVLNEDYRRLNADKSLTPSYFLGSAADCEIEFCLATVDPSGASTTGITRTSTTKTSFSDSGNPVKFATYGHTIWDRNKYLNIWVCDLGSGLLGYAQFPGGSATTDGVVIDYAYTGRDGSALSPYDLGRSATHEVGHWLNLYHIWGDDGTSCSGSDLVADTPNQADEHYGCPSTAQVSCSNGPNGDQYQNYMDYTDDACMNMFTTGQKTRMQALFATGGARVSLLTSTGCSGGGGGSCGVASGLSTTSITTSGATLNWGAVTGATSYNVQYKLSSSGTWTSTTSATTSKAISGLAAGTSYDWQVQTVCASGTSSYSSTVTFTTTGGGGTCTDIGESNNTSGTAYTLTAGTTYHALIASSTDKDYYKFTTTSPNTKIKVTVTSLPGDYDVVLYNQSVVQKGISENGGTSDETIIWNTTAAGQRYIQVYGYSGAFSTSDCYDLLIQTSSSNFRTDGSEIVFEDNYDNSIVGIYPNPVMNGSMNVDYFSVQEDMDVQVTIVDLLGNVVKTLNSNVTSGENLIPVKVDGLAAGVYVVQISNGKSRYNEKFIVQ